MKQLNEFVFMYITTTKRNIKIYLKLHELRTDINFINYKIRHVEIKYDHLNSSCQLN